MADNKGNGKAGTDFNPSDIPALMPEITNPGRLISPNLEASNPGVRLISNEDKLPDMLKAVYVEDYDLARNVAEALGECDEFLLDENGKPDPEVERRIEWIKYILAIFCSVKGRFADAYKQTATGVLTNSMTEHGWTLLNLPGFSRRSETDDAKNHKQSGTQR